MTLLDQRPVRTLRPPPTARRMARVLVVDGEAIVRFGLRQLFAADPDLVVVGEAAGPRDRSRWPTGARPISSSSTSISAGRAPGRRRPPATPATQLEVVELPSTDLHPDAAKPSRRPRLVVRR